MKNSFNGNRTGFGISSNYQRPTRNEADQFGGDIKDLMSYEYEKEFIQKAKDNDQMFQNQKKRLSNIVLSKDTVTSKKR